MSQIPFVKRKVAAFDRLAVLVGEHLLSLGGKPDPIVPGHDEARWSINTKIGKLTVTVPTAIRQEDGSIFFVGNLLTVNGRFEDVKAAVDVFGAPAVNPYSGKWNHHSGDVTEGAEPEELFKQWSHSLARVLEAS